jgi:hypothetical protein
MAYILLFGLKPSRESIWKALPLCGEREALFFGLYAPAMLLPPAEENVELRICGLSMSLLALVYL